MSTDQLDLLSWMPPAPVLAPPAKLRPYQVEAVDACIAALRGGKHPVLNVATGGGKSRIIAALCDHLQDARILVATHRQELLEQNAAQLASYIDTPSDYGIYSAGLARRESAGRILFGGIQSIYTKMEMLQQHGMFRYVIVDEAHLCGPPSMGDTMYATVFRACPHAQRIGLTATPYRLDSGLLHEGGDTWFDCMPVNVGIRSLTPAYLAPLAGVLTAHDIDVSQVRTRMGEFVTSDLSQAACEETAVKGAIEELCFLASARKKWLLFCVDVSHAKVVTLALRERGISAEMVTGTTPQDERQDLLRRFRQGQFRAISNVGVLTTGFDVPDIDCVVLLRPTQSKSLVVQMLGRATRKSDGKLDALVLDFAGDIERHAPLDDLFTLTKSPAREAADEERERAAAAERERKAKHAQRAALLDPMAEHPDRTPQTYRVERMSFQVRPAKKFTGRNMLLVNYLCPDRPRGAYVTTFVLLEHPGWAREQAAAWFERRGKPVPLTAKDGLKMAWSCQQPTHIVVREDSQFPRVVMEHFDTGDSICDQ